MKHLKLILAFCLFLSLAACSDDDNGSTPTTPTDSTRVIPLKTGNQWFYTQYEAKDSSTVSIKCVSETTKDSTACFQIENGEDLEFYYNSTDGLHAKISEDSKFELLFKYPCTVGSSYMIGDTTIKVISVTDTVTVQAGKFACIKYSVEIEQEIKGSYFHALNIYHICPAVGIIVREYWESEVKTIPLKIKYMNKLKNYTLK